MIDCFHQSRRMTELADALALTSAAMVNSPEPVKTKKKPDGLPRVDIWNIELASKANDSGSSRS